MSSGGLIQSALGKSFLQWSALSKTNSQLSPVQSARQDYAEVNYGGSGSVSGTIKIGTVAVKRRVRLYEARTGILIREIWSASDGAYSFPSMSLGVKYTVTSTDFTDSYNDVIAANITAI